MKTMRRSHTATRQLSAPLALPLLSETWELCQNPGFTLNRRFALTARVTF